MSDKSHGTFGDDTLIGYLLMLLTHKVVINDVYIHIAKLPHGSSNIASHIRPYTRT